MINPNFNIDNSSMNAVKAKVELYSGSTLVKTCTCGDVLQDFTVNRVEDNGKFFGFGICQKITLTLIDLQRELSITKGHRVEAAFGDGTNFVYPYPTFHIDEATRDEDTNSITTTAYDALYGASAHTVSELGLVAPYTIRDVAIACAEFFGLNDIVIIGVSELETCFDTSYENGANFGGSETIRQVLNAIAEATQTIYYISNSNELVFKRLDVSGDPVYTITKDDYFSLKTGSLVPLEAIYHVTELGDNVYVGLTDGITQYVRENPFWALREDIDVLLDDAIAAVSGLSINQFTCEDWVGNYLLEIGDKIALITEDGSSVISYVMDDTVVFDGTLAEATQWAYEPNDEETPANPTSLGERLNQTYARVDKAEKRVEIVASEVEGYSGRMSALEVTTEGIDALVKSTKETTDSLTGDIETLSESVNTKISADEITAEFVTELGVGANSVKTSTTGFTFNDEGLTISKSDSEMSTQITEDGMTVSRNGEVVLTADNQGVKAVNLHATTYLIIGNNSRLEDWTSEDGEERTACFWIGG